MSCWCDDRLAGAVRQSLPFDDSQGQPLLLDTNCGHLAVLTSKAMVCVFKLLGTEVKPHAGPGEHGAWTMQAWRLRPGADISTAVWRVNSHMHSPLGAEIQPA